MPVRTAVCLLMPPTLLAAACAGSPSSAGSKEPPALTKAQAAQVLASYSAAAARAGERLDIRSLKAVETGPQLTMDTASYKLHRVARQKPRAPRFDKPVYYIPRTKSYPRWFAVDAFSGSGKELLRHALLFTQAGPGAPWLLGAAPFPADASLSKVALDGEGYATAVPPSAEGLAVAPDRIAIAHAALMSGGPSAPGASAMAAGPKTGQAYDALRTAQGQLKKIGVTLASRFSAAPAPIYALRTKDKGALVWYVLRQHEAYTTPKRGRLAVTGDLTGLAPARSAKTRLESTVLIQYLAAVPPKGRATVTGMYRKAVAADGS
ncbi:hypothetical protein [Spirillospora sp. CA-294931]|uniref:hypothetical protein n=1 Tax=Spirillospora sp. CA-294931 TaxID=3240042 RepID=UPI003D8EEAD4